MAIDGGQLQEYVCSALVVVNSFSRHFYGGLVGLVMARDPMDPIDVGHCVRVRTLIPMIKDGHPKRGTVILPVEGPDSSVKDSIL